MPKIGANAGADVRMMRNNAINSLPYPLGITGVNKLPVFCANSIHDELSPVDYIPTIAALIVVTV